MLLNIVWPAAAAILTSLEVWFAERDLVYCIDTLFSSQEWDGQSPIAFYA